MKFQTITIFGLGLIGGSIAAALRHKRVPMKIIGVDKGPVIQKALSLNLIHSGFSITDDFGPGLAETELVILAAPIKQILELLERIPSKLQPGTLVTDVGSTKECIVETAHNHLPQDVYFLGAHPMAGSEKSGVEHADPFLFENAVYILTERETVPEEILASFVEFIDLLGAAPLFLPAQFHDEIAAAVSHLPQLLSVTLMQCARKRSENNPALLKLAGGGFRDMTRIASSPYSMWADIFETNRENIESVLSEFQAVLEKIKLMFLENRLRPIFEEAGRSRLSIPHVNRGFLNPYFDVVVIVEDKPGVIAEIASSLAEKNINIKDIEILKVREGEAGTLRLAFESHQQRESAIKLLAQKGYQATSRD
ncbi:MAG: prephenate dehydrogenase/arogenate dehydrogenase family protein [bacterium]